MYTTMFRVRGTRLSVLLRLLVLTVALLLPCGLMVAGATGDRQSRTEPTPGALDFSNPVSEATVEVKASSLVALLIDGTPHPAESLYLDSVLVESPFKYSDAVPPSYVETAYNHNILNVTVRPYTYTAVNGESVTWIPDTVSLGERTVILTHNASAETYTCTLENVAESTESRLEVHFTATITIPASEGDAYRNYAYRYADRLISEQKAYESSLAAYDAYVAYLAAKSIYDRDIKVYESYVVAKEKYDKKLAEYQTYEKALAEYRQNMAAHEAYLSALDTYRADKAAYDAAFAAYVEAQNAYNAALPLYEAYRHELDTITDCMAVFDSIFVKNSKGKQMYATLMGDTVATVVDRKDELILYGGCDEKDIDTCAAATETLKTLLTEYKALKKRADKLAFYQAHYAEIRQCFMDLYGSLYSLYDNGLVRSTLMEKKKLDRFIEFISQLYVISSGLDDTQNRLSDWTIEGRLIPGTTTYRTHTYQEKLEPVQIPADKNNSDPSSLTYPAVAVPEPTPPAPMTLREPTPPAEVLRPMEPDAVTKPTEPARVEKPTEPIPVPDPGEKPIAPAYTTLQKDLMAAHQNGTLSLRPSDSDTPLSLETTLTRRLSLQNKRPVEFFDYDGRTLLFATELDDGDPIIAPDVIPTRPDTEQYTYRFVGWKDENGQPVADLGVVDEREEVFYASYESTLRRYPVTFRVNGQDTVIEFAYGTTPVFEGIPAMPETAQYTFTFAGWCIPDTEGRHTELPPVVGPAVYEASFEPILRRYNVTFVWNDGKDSHTALWDWGTLPALDEDPRRPEDDRCLYTFIGWDKTLEAVTGDVTYTAVYEAVPILLPEADANGNPPALTLRDDTYYATLPENGLWTERLFSLAVSHDRGVCLAHPAYDMELIFNAASVEELAEAGCTQVRILSAGSTRARTSLHVQLLLTDDDGEAVSLHYPVTLRIKGASAATVAYTIAEDGTPTPLPIAYADGVATVKVAGEIACKCEILVRDEYALTLSPVEGGMLSVDRLVYEAGETVTLSLTHPAGFEPDTLYAVGRHTGTIYPIGENLTFQMPAEPVTVEATLRRRTFTITFISDGVVISRETYHFGDTVRLPSEPVKEDSETTVFTFAGWSPAVTTVTEDVTYTAIFTQAAQGDPNAYIPTDSKNREYRIFLIGGLFLAVLIGTPIGIVKGVKRHKRRKQRAEAEPSDILQSPEPTDPVANCESSEPTEQPAPNEPTEPIEWTDRIDSDDQTE